MKIVDIHQISRHQTTVEQHGKKDKKGQRPAVRQCLDRKRICHQRRHRDIQNRTDDRHNNGDPVSPQDLIALSDDILVGIETELLREKGIAVSDQHVFIRKRGKEHQHKG